MKRIYYLIRHLDCLHPDDFVYHVKVGISFREVAKAELIRQFCADNKWYWGLRNLDVHSRIMDAAAKWSTDGYGFGGMIHFPVMSVNAMYKMLVDGSLDDYESSYKLTPQEVHALFHKSPQYIQSINKKKSNTPCPLLT